MDIEDCLDERGSYRVTFRFSPENVSKYFSPPVLTKTVTFSEDQPGDAKAEATAIQWTNGKVRRSNMVQAAADVDNLEQFDHCRIWWKSLKRSEKPVKEIQTPF